MNFLLTKIYFFLFIMKQIMYDKIIRRIFFPDSVFHLEKNIRICYDKRLNTIRIYRRCCFWQRKKVMNQKALSSLEYPKIIERLTEKASSPMGKELCRKLQPSTDINRIRLMQTQTKDALTRLFQKGSVSFWKCKGYPRLT